jgi:hypothetical protein
VVTVAVAAVLVIVVAGALWARVTSTRAERRSLETYERTLGVLGDVARRSDAVADVHVPEEIAQPHVRPSATGWLPHPVQSSVRILPHRDGGPGDAHHDGAAGDPAARADPPTVLAPVVARVDPPTVLVPVVRPADRDGVEAEPELPGDRRDDPGGPETEAATEPAPRRRLDVLFDADGELDADAGGARLAGHRDIERNGRPGPERTIRRAATGAAAAVAIGALAIGGYQLATHKSGATASPSSPTHLAAAPQRARHHRTAPRRTPVAPPAAPATLQPSSTSAGVVTYQLHAPAYTVSFSAASGACWLGAQQLVGGPYVKMWTLAPGEQASYAATGPLVVKIGAPRYITIAVDGTPLALPAGRDQPYDVSLVPGSTATA